MKVKICGIRSINAAQAAVAAGTDFLGFNFVPGTSRTVSVGKVKEILKGIRGKIQTVGIFQNAPLVIVNAIVEELHLDFVQLHGNESAEYCKKVVTKVIKKISVLTQSEFEKYNVHYFLVDRNKKDDTPLDMQKVKEFTKMNTFFLAGGLTPENIRSVVQNVQPFGVDVARGIETNGKEDVEKIVRFIQAAKEAVI